MARKRKKKRWGYIVTISIVLVLLGGLAGTLGWVYERGVKREGLFDSATRAMRERRYEDTIRLSKQTLAESESTLSFPCDAAESKPPRPSRRAL